MPSKEELFIMGDGAKLAVSAKSVTLGEAGEPDLEQLTSDIKNKLRLSTPPAPVPYLKASPAYHHHAGYHNKKCRPSPYKIPCRSLSEPACDNCIKYNRTNCWTCLNKHRNSPTSQGDTLEDAQETLQTLFRNQSLIKEAVRRIQNGDHAIRKQFVYDDSDEDLVSPLYLVPTAQPFSQPS